tara:strand:- start:48 stop:422 length:375 start_codon:yes stop_codon:yes gene_type:complete
MLIKKGVKMNKTETVKFLEENNISFFVFKNGDITVADNARKLLKNLSKKTNLRVMGKDWNYNDKVGKLTFKGQKVWDATLVFDNDKLLGINVEFSYKIYEMHGVSHNRKDSFGNGYSTANFMIG